jgi:hypothetical protein
MTKTKGCILLFAALLLFPFGAHAANHTWNSDQPPTNVEDGDTVVISGTISDTLPVPDGVTVTITGTANTPNDAALKIELNIGDGATVKWNAKLTGPALYLISLSGAGVFEVIGGKISSSDEDRTAIFSQGDCATIVKVSGGTVQMTGRGSKAISIFGNVEIKGGIVCATNVAISTTSGNVEVWSGTVQASTAISVSINHTIIVNGGVQIDGSITHGGLRRELYTVTFSASGTGTAKDVEISAEYDGVAIQSGAKVTKGKKLVITVDGVNDGKNDDYTYEWTGADSTLNVAIINPLTSDVNVACIVIDKTKPGVSSVTPSGAGAEIEGSIAITFNEAMNREEGTVSLNESELTGGAWRENTYTVSYSGLDYGTVYTITLSGFKDTVGNEMDKDSSHSFTTKTKPVPDPDPGDGNDGEFEPNPIPNPGGTPGPIPDFEDNPPGPDRDPSPDPSPNPDPGEEAPEEAPNDDRSSTTMTNAGITLRGVRYVIERQADGTWLIVVPHGTDISKLAITFLLPKGAACVPASGSIQDFSGKTMVYKVTSADKTKTEEYKIRVIEKPLTVTPVSIVSDTTGAQWSISAIRRADGSYRVSIAADAASTFAQIPDDIYVLIKGLLTNVAIALLDADGKPLQTYPDNDPIPRALLTENAPSTPTVSALVVTGAAASRKELESIAISRIDWVCASDPGVIFEQEISPALTYDKIATKLVDHGSRDEDKETESGGCSAGFSEIAGLAAIALPAGLCHRRGCKKKDKKEKKEW